MAEALKAEYEFTAEEKEQWKYEQREKFLRDRISRESRAREEGVELGAMRERKAIIHKLMENLKIDINKAMEIVGMSDEEQKKYLEFLEQADKKL